MIPEAAALLSHVALHGFPRASAHPTITSS